MPPLQLKQSHRNNGILDRTMPAFMLLCILAEEDFAQR